MQLIPAAVQRGYLQLFAPVVRWCVERRVSPNLITLVGTAAWVAGGVFYAAGWINAGGWWLGVTAFFDVVDGKVARATGRETTFGALFDSTLDRVADAAVIGGLTYFYATNTLFGSPQMVVICLACMTGMFLTSYTRARGESLGLGLKVGFMQRPERVVLLSAPMAFFGLALDGIVLMAVVLFLTATSWLTVVERLLTAHRTTRLNENSGAEHVGAHSASEPKMSSETGTR